MSLRKKIFEDFSKENWGNLKPEGVESALGTKRKR